MRIFILPTSYPSNEYPHKNIFIYEQAKQLAKMGHEIIVLHIEKLPTRSIFQKVSRNIEVFRNDFSVRYVRKQKTFMEARFPVIGRDVFIENAIELYKYAVAKHGKPDVVYAHFSQWAGYTGTILSEKYNVPLVTIEHYSGLMKNKVSNSLLEGVKRTIEKSEYFLCVSENLKKNILDKTKIQKDIYVITNMIDSSFKYFSKLVHDGFVFSAIGRLTAQKDYRTLIRAFDKAFDRDEMVQLRIAGDGEDRTYLEKLVKQLGREKQIIFLGSLTRAQTIEEYKLCDCFALSSSYETFGLVYREALAVGRPIITTDHGGFSEEDWHNEYGYKVPVGDVDEFAKAMKKIVLDNNKFDGQMISELCLSDCSADVIGSKIEYILQKAIGNEK